MSEILRRVPKLIYVLAVMFFAWSVGNSYWEFRLTNLHAAGDDPTVAYAKSKALFQASIDSVFLFTSGVMIDVLIRIFDKLPAVLDGGPE
jgi:hypothetical protein